MTSPAASVAVYEPAVSVPEPVRGRGVAKRFTAPRTAPSSAMSQHRTTSTSYEEKMSAKARDKDFRDRMAALKDGEKAKRREAAERRREREERRVAVEKMRVQRAGLDKVSKKKQRAMTRKQYSDFKAKTAVLSN
jgi:hypothetical protein